MKSEISYDLAMEGDMEFVEGSFRLPNGEWQVVVVSRRDIERPELLKQRWESGVSGAFIRFPRNDPLNMAVVENLLSTEFGVSSWDRVRGPDSMQLR